MNQSFGASLRAGTVVGNSLLYLKAGAVNTELQYNCCLPAVFVPVNQSDRVWGARFGGGVETFLGGGFALRADYSFTSFNTANFSANTLEPRRLTYDSRGSALRFGLAYHFGSKGAPLEHARFAGLYGGLAGSYGNFASGPLDPTDGEVSASAYGAGLGIMGGYRYQLNRFVLGVEVDAAAYDVKYSDPSFGGGQFHEMKDTFGVSAQLGYVFGKVGPVWHISRPRSTVL